MPHVRAFSHGFTIVFLRKQVMFSFERQVGLCEGQHRPRELRGWGHGPHQGPLHDAKEEPGAHGELSRAEPEDRPTATRMEVGAFRWELKGFKGILRCFKRNLMGF